MSKKWSLVANICGQYLARPLMLPEFHSLLLSCILLIFPSGRDPPSCPKEDSRYLSHLTNSFADVESMVRALVSTQVDQGTRQSGSLAYAHNCPQGGDHTGKVDLETNIDETLYPRMSYQLPLPSNNNHNHNNYNLNHYHNHNYYHNHNHTR